MVAHGELELGDAGFRGLGLELLALDVELHLLVLDRRLVQVHDPDHGSHRIPWRVLVLVHLDHDAIGVGGEPEIPLDLVVPEVLVGHGDGEADRLVLVEPFLDLLHGLLVHEDLVRTLARDLLYGMELVLALHDDVERELALGEITAAEHAEGDLHGERLRVPREEAAKVVLDVDRRGHEPLDADLRVRGLPVVRRLQLVVALGRVRGQRDVEGRHPPLVRFHGPARHDAPPVVLEEQVDRGVRDGLEVVHELPRYGPDVHGLARVVYAPVRVDEHGRRLEALGAGVGVEVGGPVEPLGALLEDDVEVVAVRVAGVHVRLDREDQRAVLVHLPEDLPVHEDAGACRWLEVRIPGGEVDVGAHGGPDLVGAVDHQVQVAVPLLGGEAGRRIGRRLADEDREKLHSARDEPGIPAPLLPGERPVTNDERRDQGRDRHTRGRVEQALLHDSSSCPSRHSI